MTATEDRRENLESSLPVLRVSLLGPFNIDRAGQPIPAWPRPQAKLLFKVLAISDRRRITKASLMERLWPSDSGGVDEAQQRQRLTNILHQLRTTLDPVTRPASNSPYVQEDEGLLSLAMDYFSFDTDEFEDLAATPLEHDERTARLRQALALYRGPLLEGDNLLDGDLSDEVQRQRDYYHTLWLDAAIELAEALRDAGQLPDAIALLRRLVVAEPCEERAIGHLMELLATTGRSLAALRQYERHVEALHDQFGSVEPSSALMELHAAITAREVPLRLQPPTPQVATSGLDIAAKANVPAPRTSLIGRDTDLTLAIERLSSSRLVTLTGPGGVGKTRLAIAIANSSLPNFPGGVWYVPLAAISDPGHVIGAIAKVLSVRETSERSLIAAVQDFLRSRRALLVIDNFEHLMTASTALSDLLARLPDVTTLVTSRQPLGIYGEVDVPVTPLEIPGPHKTRAANVSTASVQLFLERAAAVDPSFSLDELALEAVMDICRRLDGLPLALELAAARVRFFGPTELSRRLQQSLIDELVGGPVDVDPRQRTIRATVAWSYDLLNESEKRTFGCLSTFAGGCRLEAAEAVVSNSYQGHEETDVTGDILRLVDHNLVYTERNHDASPRYRMLEPIRDFAAGQLRSAGDDDAAAREHTLWFVGLAKQAEPELMGPSQSSWLDRLEEDHDNLRAVLRRSLTLRDSEVTLPLVAALWWFWWVYDYLSEGRLWMEQALASAPPEPTVLRARVLHGIGAMARAQGDFGPGEAYLRESFTLSLGLGARRVTADALHDLGGIARDQGNHSRAEGLYRESLALREAIGDFHGIGDSKWVLGNVAYNQAKLLQARELFEESLGLYNAHGSPMDIGDALRCLGDVARDEGKHGEALEYYGEALHCFERVHDQRGFAYCMEGISGVLVAVGSPRQSLVVLAAAQNIHDQLGVPLTVSERLFYDQTRASIRQELSDDEVERYWGQGTGMSLSEALHYTRSHIDNAHYGESAP